MKTFIVCMALVVFSGCKSSKIDPRTFNGYAPFPFSAKSSERTLLPAGGANLPRVTSDKPTAEQLKELEQSAVLVELDAQRADSGLGAGAGTFNEPIRSTLLFIERVEGFSFVWYFTPGINDIAISQPNGIILVNPLAAQQLPADTVIFFLFHEASHHLLGHTSSAGQWAGQTQPWLVPQMELDADARAAMEMIKAGYQRDRVMFAVMAGLRNGGDKTHPPGPVRIANVRRVLYSQ